MKARTKKLALILFLALVFALDDILLYLLLKNALDWRANLLVLTVGGTLVGGLNLLAAVVAYRSMRRRPTTGPPGMIGKIGVVLKTLEKTLRVQVRGEIWQAEAPETIKAGEKVVVEGVEGLKLIVKRHLGV
jgi:membrane protein implicated in regulation of membrane protease activity